MKLLHTADLHLDSPFAGSEAIHAEERRDVGRRVLAKIFELAKSEQCDLILIAGDLFDGKYVTPETQALCLRLFREAACPVVLAPGNHDPYWEGSFYGRRDLPENVYVFSSGTLQCFAFPSLNAKVFGYAFSSAALTERPLANAPVPEEDGAIRLLCAHADTASPVSRYAPLTEGDALRLGIQYGALGHIHNPPQPTEQERVPLRYPGIPQGRGYDETGDGQVLIVTVEQEGVTEIRPISVFEERFLEEEVDLTLCADLQAVRSTLRQIMEPLAETQGTHLRLTLTGSVPSEWQEKLLSWEQAEKGALAELILVDRTVPFTDGAYLEQDVTVKGAFYRSLYPKLTHEDPAMRARAQKALQIGLAALEGRRIPGEERA